MLLKNEEEILPLDPGASVALIGDFAETPRYQGAGSGMVNCTRLDTLTDALRNSGLLVQGYAAGFNRHGGVNPGLEAQAVALAKMSGSWVSMEMVDGLVMEARVFGVIGLVRTLGTFLVKAWQDGRLARKLQEKERWNGSGNRQLGDRMTAPVVLDKKIYERKRKHEKDFET